MKKNGNDIRIVVGQRGWVWVGRYSATEKEVTISDAKCIRRWGTTKGLGELIAGPTGSTALDPAGTVKLHPLAVVATYSASLEAWEKHLGS